MKCPTCGKPRDQKFKPFCSKRCADLDLARWLNGTYAIPAAEDDDGSTVPEDDLGPVPGAPAKR